eukprot:TRINITY_DN25093_c0_g1_i2.p1 TRINITY_DN25093_c0_g1~~TRINITY_DN25093_c0_g1_i2.p1  ORF type:complete len:172 (+),score=38.32 TRINITY_DN25093_c0_g1_i2:25-516(+)
MAFLFQMCCAAEDQSGAVVDVVDAEGAKSSLAGPPIHEEKKSAAVTAPVAEISSSVPPKDVDQFPLQAKNGEVTLLVTVQKTPAMMSLGLDLGHKKTDYLTVKAVLPEGLISRWNASASDQNQVKTGDQIFDVNGRKNAEPMLAEIKNCGSGQDLVLRIRRKV